MYTSLRNIIDAHKLNSNVFEHLQQIITTIKVCKGSLLIKKGQFCNSIYIIESGFARIFSDVNQKETTILFAKENDVITSTYSLFEQKRSHENIEMLEDSVLLKINYNELVNLCESQSDLFKVYRLLMEKYYLSLEERTLSLQFDNALERYRKLLSHHPFILQRASLSQIASYLGMSPVTLSRMRGKIQ